MAARRLKKAHRKFLAVSGMAMGLREFARSLAGDRDHFQTTLDARAWLARKAGR